MKVTAQARRTGDWWAVEVPEVDGVFTQAKRLDQVPEVVADAVALLEDVAPSAVEVQVVPVVPDAVAAALMLAKQHREEAEALNVEASTIVRQTALDLTGLGYSMRDIGVVLGVSHQRVAQLLTPRPMTIKEAGDAATRAMNRSVTKKTRGNVRSTHKHVVKKGGSKTSAAAALSQVPKKSGSRSVAAKASRQPKA
ncbi:hypothetical protein [Aeromicrobium sp. Root472D3]|uniref:hypothetical protein n=1 Tax=Aeromicrobium sp. Root472D3 TaxID=1736540 RepID=UPI000ABB14FE|nr:hypothetical protein [Aeromicrobium sp. Root472D3]